jgi:DNA polymerase-1
MELEAIRTHIPDARQESDGSITFVCPICETEGHQNKRATIFANGAIACTRFASAGRDAHREHCGPIRELLGLDSKPEAFIAETLFDGKLSLECTPAKQGKVRIVARNCSSVLNRDVLDLNRLDHRSQFIKGLFISDEDSRREINQAMIRLADRFDSVQSAVDDESEAGTSESVIFKELSDGRLIEQLDGGIFAVYDGSSVTNAKSIECRGVTYKPISGDPCIEDNDLHLPGRLTEYGEEKLLDEEIEDYLSKFCDAHSRELKFAAKLIRLTYIQDRLNEVPYLHIVGPSGSGKTRMSDVVGIACYHPYLIVEGSAASTFRISDKYGVTMCFDEFNPMVDSEDQAALIQILNAGFQRRRKVPRVEKGPNGEFVTRSFRPFGIKIFSGLRLTGSYAFQRRTIPIQLSVTTNPKIPYCDDGSIEELSAPLREKLTLWRLRNLKKDYRSLIRKTEAIFKSREILPGFIQIGVPLAMLIADDGLRNDFISTMESRTTDAAEDRQQSFDGQIVGLVHGRLFDVDDDGKARWKVKGDLPLLEEGKPCEALRVELLADLINQNLPEKKKVEPRSFGKFIRGVGFRTKEIKTRESAFRNKSAIVYDPAGFAKVFNSFSLPIPGDFNPPNPPRNGKSNPDNEMQVGGLVSDLPSGEMQSPQRISLIEQDLTEVGGLGGLDSQEDSGEDFSVELSDQSDAIPAFVALDTETERFDEKRGVTSRNAKMIGLALSYDGEGQTDYNTDPEAWPLLMPEPEQTVIFHNAKFDLGVLQRTGLPTPGKWEDTLIAAHLLKETGDHGLKPLAKEHLGIDDPTTFEEADRMRLLNPEIFDEYARNDARYTFRLWPKFQREMERQGLLTVYGLEKAVVPVVMTMEEAGMKLDLAEMLEMRRTVQSEAEAIESEIYEHAGCRFDLRSPQKVSAILFDKLGVPSTKETKNGQRSVNKEALEAVRGYHPTVDAIVRHREIDKLASTFLSVLPTFADDRGRIHPEFKQLGATSGRFSCSNPNVQQIPARSELGKKLRRMFVADEGNTLVVADWSQMELRILAQYSKDPLLLSAYQSEIETDLHTLTASRMFGKTEAEVSKPERSVAKMINFGIAYGITPIGLFNRLRPQGVDVTEKQCEQFVADYFKTYPGVRRFLDQVEPRLRERGYVKNWFGRRRRVSGRTPREVRQAQNFIIQSTAADMAKTAMVRLYESLPEGARLIAMVHDEFIVECRTELAEEVRSLMVSAMQAAPEGFIVPMVVEAKIAGNWGDAK